MRHRILFTGHMIDAADRPALRFPAYKEEAARQAIKKSLLHVMREGNGEFLGIAGGASGGDILFHELCLELNIPSEIYLALPVEEFKKVSVSYAGSDWDVRFDKLKEKLPVHILPDVEEKNSSTVWERANLWMLNAALKEGGSSMSLIALWDGKGGDGSGGTEHMVHISEEQGARTYIININQI